MTDREGSTEARSLPDTPVRPPMSGVAGDSVSVATWTIVSRITGFLRVVVIAAVLGPTFFGNLFQTVNVLPNLTYELLAGTLVTALLIPPLVRAVDARDHFNETRLARGFLGVLTLAFTVVIVVTIVLGPLVMRILTVAVPDPDVQAAQISAGWPLLVMLMPQALLYAVAQTGVAVQNTHGRFALAAAAPIAENIGIILVMLASAVLFGTGVAVEGVSTQQLLLLGLGTTAAVGAHAGIQWWGARRVGVALYPLPGWRDPEVREIIRLAIPSAGYAGLAAIRQLGVIVVAGGIEGGVVAFQIGTYFYQVPVAVGARPIIVAQLPRLSRAFNQGKTQLFHASYRAGMSLILFATIPATMMLVVLAQPLARAVSFGEMATSSAILLTTIAIATLGGAVVGESMFLASTSASYATRDAKSPMLGMALRVALTAVGVAIALTVVEGDAVLGILGLSIAIPNLVAAVWLHKRLTRALPEIPTERLPQWLIDVAIAAVAAFVGGLVAWLLPSTGEAIVSLATAAAACLALVVTYLFIQRLRGSQELDDYRGAVLRGKNA